jgi:DUF1680 family protein
VINQGEWTVQLDSSLPWGGKVRLTLDSIASLDFTVHFRLPSWARAAMIRINGESFSIPSSIYADYPSSQPVASGFDPRLARFLPVQRTWSSGDVVDLNFEMPIVLRHASTRLHGHKGKVALTRGPLVYCLESNDNVGIDIFSARIDPNSIHTEPAPALLDGIWILRGRTIDEREFIAIPYHLWANRGKSQMTVWLNT